MHHGLLIHLATEGHLACLQVWAMTYYERSLQIFLGTQTYFLLGRLPSGLPQQLRGKESPAKEVRRVQSGRSSGEGNGNPLQHSCLGNPTDREAWRAAVHGGHKRAGHDLATKQQQISFHLK